MNLDEIVAKPEPAEAEADIKMEDNEPQREVGEVRKEAIYLGGIDQLSQKDVEKFVAKFTAIQFAIEWVDDHGLKLVFDTPELAAEALTALQDPDTPAEVEDLTIRTSKAHPKLACNFQLRYATTADIKADKSRNKSAYYLNHGAPSWKADRVRFGTDRSAPMKYGRKGDMIDRKKIAQRTGDLFPHLSAGGGEDDLFPHLKGKGGGRKQDDLFPHLVKGGGIKKSKKKKRNNNKDNKMEVEDDLFPLKSEPAKEESVYSRMDY